MEGIWYAHFKSGEFTETVLQCCMTGKSRVAIRRTRTPVPIRKMALMYMRTFA